MIILWQYSLLTYRTLYRMHGIRSAGVVAVIVLGHHHLTPHGAHVDNSVAPTETKQLTWSSVEG